MLHRPFRVVSRGRGLCVGLTATLAASLGCLNTDKKPEPLTKLTPDLQSKLASAAPAPSKTGPTPTFDPAATGGSNLSVQNSFGRTKPNDPAASAYAVKLPPPQLGAQPAAGVPALPGTSYASSQPPTGRVPASDRPLPPMPPSNPVVQTGGTTPLPTPKMDPPTEPPQTKSNYPALPPVAPPAKPLNPVLSTPMDLEPPLPKPEPPPPPASGGLPPVGAAPLNPLAPTATPGALTPVPSPNDSPITGIAPPVKLPPAPPIRPN